MKKIDLDHLNEVLLVPAKSILGGSISRYWGTLEESKEDFTSTTYIFLLNCNNSEEISAIIANEINSLYRKLENSFSDRKEISEQIKYFSRLIENLYIPEFKKEPPAKLLKDVSEKLRKFEVKEKNVIFLSGVESMNLN